MTPWGVTTIGASWEAHMPGPLWAGGWPHRGLDGLSGGRGRRGNEGARSGPVSQIGEQGLRRRTWGSFATHDSLNPTALATKFLSKLHPRSAGFSLPHGSTLLSRTRCGLLSGPLLSAWPPTFSARSWKDLFQSVN